MRRDQGVTGKSLEPRILRRGNGNIASSLREVASGTKQAPYSLPESRKRTIQTLDAEQPDTSDCSRSKRSRRNSTLFDGQGKGAFESRTETNNRDVPEHSSSKQERSGRSCSKQGRAGLSCKPSGAMHASHGHVPGFSNTEKSISSSQREGEASCGKGGWCAAAVGERRGQCAAAAAAGGMGGRQRK